MKHEEYELLREIEEFVRLVAARGHHYAVKARELAARLDALGSIEEIVGADAVAAEEGSELFNEATLAISGIADEPLKPCADPCIGHFGPKARALYDQGLKRGTELLLQRRDESGKTP